MLSSEKNVEKNPAGVDNEDDIDDDEDNDVDEPKEDM